MYFTIGEGESLDWKAKEIVFRMIETLLPTANYKQGEPLKLLQLWSEADESRKGWIMVNEQNESKKESLTSAELI